MADPKKLMGKFSKTCYLHFEIWPFSIGNLISNRILLEITVHFWHGTPIHWQVTVPNWFQIVSKCP